MTSFLGEGFFKTAQKSEEISPICVFKDYVTPGSMLSTIFFGKFYAGVKKLGRFTNKKYFFKFSKRTNFSPPFLSNLNKKIVSIMAVLYATLNCF